jgi:hypothetical protein
VEAWTDRNARLANAPRLRALDERLTRLAGEDYATLRRTLRGIHLLLVDATLDGDTYTLDLALDGLRRAEGEIGAREDATSDKWKTLGRVEALTEAALLALERVPSLEALAPFEPDSHAAQFMRCIAEHPGASNDLISTETQIRPEEVSRLGRELSARDFARKRKIGRRNSWDLTPRGTQMLQLIEAEGAPRAQREHRLAAYG